MKKLIAALIILALVITAATLEIVWLDRTYDGVLQRLEAVDRRIDADFEHVDNPDTVRAMEELIAYWENRRTLTMSLLNHTQTKNIDDRFVMTLTQLQVNANNDASVSVKSMLKMFADLKTDAVPNAGNMF